VIVGNDVYYTKRSEAHGAKVAEEAISRSNARDTARSYTVSGKQAKYLDKKVQRRSKMAAKGMDLDASNGFGGGAPASANAEVAEDHMGQASVSTMQAFQGSRIAYADGMNINSMGDEVICTNAETGEQMWTHKLSGDLAGSGGFLATAPAAAGKSIFIGTLEGTLLEIDPKSGKVRRSFDVGAPIRSQPIVEGGWIYVGTDDGKLVAIDAGDRKFTGWSQWGGNAARTGIAR
jgi:outer membrane protein assembly factor BamB